MSRHEAHWGGNLADEGLDWLVVVRTRGSGDMEIGAFLIDAWCLGVKDAFLVTHASRDDVDEVVGECFPGGAKEIEPACAKKLIEDAARYAEGLGFAPSRDFRKARRVLNGIDASPVGRRSPSVSMAGRASSPAPTTRPKKSGACWEYLPRAVARTASTSSPRKRTKTKLMTGGRPRSR